MCASTEKVALLNTLGNRFAYVVWGADNIEQVIGAVSGTVLQLQTTADNLAYSIGIAGLEGAYLAPAGKDAKRRMATVPSVVATARCRPSGAKCRL